MDPKSFLRIVNDTGRIVDTKIITPAGEELRCITRIDIAPILPGGGLIRATITFLATMDFKIEDAHFIERQLHPTPDPDPTTPKTT